MRIIVDSENLVNVTNAIKKLPVHGDFHASDMWVGCVMVLQKIIEEAQPYVPQETKEDSKEIIDGDFEKQ